MPFPIAGPYLSRLHAQRQRKAPDVPGYSKAKLKRIQRDLLKRYADLKDELYMMSKLESKYGRRQAYMGEARADLELVRKLNRSLAKHPMLERLEGISERRLKANHSEQARALARKHGFTLRQVFTLFFSP